MGLDMYLSKRTYIGANYEHNAVTGTIDIFRRGEHVNIDLHKVTYIYEEVAYWRKANHIHRWFVENVQNGEDDCREYEVSGKQLKELIKLCRKVLRNKSKADELLPTQSGFFFGGTDYDEYYFEDIKNTIKMLKDIKEDEDYEYCASW